MKPKTFEIKTHPSVYMLGVALVLLKALGKTNIGWGWVLLPFYGTLLICLVLVLFFFVIQLLARYL